MRKLLSLSFIVVANYLLVPTFVVAQAKSSIVFTVSMEQAANHYFHVDVDCKNFKGDTVLFKMPVWTPGYYQNLNFPANVENFKAKDAAGKELKVEKNQTNGWKVYSKKSPTIHLSYDVKTVRPFVATPYVDEDHAYIIPTGVFVHVANKIKHPATVMLKPLAKWNRVATGLDSVKGKMFTYTAPDFDILYDCPILIGNLEDLPAFTVSGIPHRFIGYKMGDFDRAGFMADLKKVVTTASGLIGDIPYKHYTFIGIGPGAGGIEHLNSTTVSFNGTAGWSNKEAQLRTLHFLAHEYYHHYNVKRIRPIELGPFDYDNGSRTKMLWVSEGLSVYYEYLVVRRAGLSSEDELLNSFRENLVTYENKPGRLFQSLTQSSYDTWSNGPMVTDPNKTISYYDKGPVIGLMLDFAIRHESNNKKSLDDVMRAVYHKYYQQKKRGFTEDEFRAECEQAAGKPLPEIFDYISTTNAPDYKKYFAYGGLDIDTTVENISGGWLGLNARPRNDSLFVTAVDYNSPASGLVRPRSVIFEVDGKSGKDLQVSSVLQNKKPGDTIQLVVINDGEKKVRHVILGQKSERKFHISHLQNPDALQSAILKDWLE